MKCAVVIVTYNSVEHIERCVNSVLEHCPAAELVVVDNGSTDGTVEKVRLFGDKTTLIRNERNLGFGQANNVGMRALKADLYLLLNADAWLTSDIVTEVEAYCTRGEKIDIAGPQLVYPDGSYQTSAFPFSSPAKWILQDLGLRKVAFGLSRSKIGRGILKAFRFMSLSRPFVNGLLMHGGEGEGKRRESVDLVTGACMIISRAAFEATGGFDENIFMYGEDEELCFRARKMGLGVERVSAGPVVHCCGAEVNKDDKEFASRVYESMKYVINKNYADRPVRRWLMHQLLKSRCRRSARRSLRG